MVREDSLYDFNYFKFMENCFMTNILKNAPCALEKNVHVAFVAWSVLYMSLGLVDL